jgi:short-subunit dehydrogenase involved in D-alanine esterification of teichoic acids
MQLINKNILITGATSGIGLALVAQLHRNNNIYIIARNQNKINELTTNYPSVTAFKADLSNLKELELVVGDLCQQVSRLDVLINNAAVQYPYSLLDKQFRLSSVTEEVMVNFVTPVSLSYLLLPLLNQKHQASILNVSSGLAIAPKASSAVYCASKAALNSFSQSLQYQLTDTKISVLQAFLPLVDTQMTKGRGQSKLTPKDAATRLVKGIQSHTVNHDIGKVKLLRIIDRILPSLAKKLMRNA